MKKYIQYTETLILKFFIAPILYLYEKYIMYRIKEAWGYANAYKIKNKGNNVKIVGYTRILNPENIMIGNNVRIGYNCFLFGKGGITIDDGTIISRNVTIYSANHNYNSDVIPYDSEYINKPVFIGKCVWIGMNVSIKPGVKIGDGAIIGMGAVINKDVGEGEIVVCQNHALIAKRNMENFTNQLRLNNIFSIKNPNL